MQERPAQSVRWQFQIDGRGSWGGVERGKRTVLHRHADVALGAHVVRLVVSVGGRSGYGGQ